MELGRKVGVTDRDVARLIGGPGASGWSPREQTLLAAVDELHFSGDLANDAPRR